MSGTESPSHAPITPETIHIQPIDDIHISDLEDEEEKHISPTRIRQRYILGVILLLCVVCLWVASSTIIQAIFVDLHFGSPFFLTYYSTSLFTIYIGVYYIQQWFKKWRTSHRTLERLSVSSSPTTREMARLTPSSQSISDTAHLALFLCPIWFLMNYLFNLSLNMTSVASNTILSTLSGFFVMTFSWILFGTRPAIMNMVGVALTITGAVCISLKPENDPSGSGQSDTIAGDLVASTSAIFYGLYTVMLRYKIPDESKVNMLLMFGFIGLFNLLLFWPAFFVLNTMEWERFQWPQRQVIMFLTLNGLFGTVVSDFLWAKSVLLTSPLIATLGLSLTIPIAMITDFLLHHTSFSALYLLGSVLVLAGFILVNYHFKRDIDTNIRRTSLEGQHSSFDEREHSSSVSSNTESRIPLDPTEHR